LKHRRYLTLTQSCQENYASIWKFQRIVVLEWFILVDLSKDCRRVIYFVHLPPWDERIRKCHGVGKRKLSSWKNANRHFSIFRRSKPASTCAKVTGVSPTFAGRDLTL
jgi:hypothetical protein